MVEDCQALVQGCQDCCIFKGAIPKAAMCPIRAHALLELVHIDFMSGVNNGAQQAAQHQECVSDY